MTLQRYSSSAIPATGMVFLIFLLMQGLVRNDFTIPEPTRPWISPFDRTIPPDEPIVRTKKPEPIEEAARQPRGLPLTPVPVTARPQPLDFTPNIGSIGMPGSKEIDVTFDGATNAELTSIAKVAPIYPPVARARNIEGDVLVKFAVTDKGLVEDCHVIEDPSSGILGRAACKAALQFRYKPQMMDGQAVMVAGVRNMFTFRLDDAK